MDDYMGWKLEWKDQFCWQTWFDVLWKDPSGCTAPVSDFQGHVWHPACFKCETCQQPIAGTFARINGKLTCTECRDQVLSAEKDAAALKEVRPLDDLPICRGCKKPVQQHEDCPYFCDRCAELERSKGEEHQTTVRNTCAVCGETCDEEEDAFQLLDGGILHWKCFKCSRCGRMEEKTSDSTQMALLRSKVCNAIKGKHYCATCNGSAEAPGDSCEAPSKGYPSPATVPEAPAASTPATAPVAVSAEPVESIPQAATSREQMLSDADFENTFGMTKENFGKLPAWKKGQKKREVGLF
ncbi:Villin-5 [Durusdinium trenchii]|uniref:Villin-5 n=1 Tax=Durusdinium trenchii TaxID=1381693 RepID=A0ABP0M5H3_9DINO